MAQSSQAGVQSSSILALLPARLMPGAICVMLLASGEEQSDRSLALFPSALPDSGHSKTTRTTCRWCPAQRPLSSLQL